MRFVNWRLWRQHFRALRRSGSNVLWAGLELALLREAWGALYTMVLAFLASCEQNITIWRLQGVGAVEVATIFGKMNGICAFVEARGGRWGFGRG